MDRRVWLDVGEPITADRVRVSITTVRIYPECRAYSYSVVHGSVEWSSLDTLECSGVQSLRDDSGEWNIEPLHPLAKKYLLRTWEPL